MSTTPVLAHSREELAGLLADRSGAVSLVPTMGALHEGHASLMRTARERTGPGAPLVVSVFVDPMQFAPGEDLDRYPRTFDADLAVCAREGVDVVFHPEVDEVYPGGTPQVTVDPGPLATELEVAAAENLKRVRRAPAAEPDWTADPGLAAMTAFLETKTVWHPIGV